MKRKSICENDASEDQAIIAEYRNSCGSPKKLKKSINFNINFKDENCDDILIAQQIHGILENIEKEDHKRKTLVYKSKWRQSKGKSDKVLIGKCEGNVETDLEFRNDMAEVCINNDSHGLHGQSNEDAENLVESSSNKPYNRRMVKTGNQLLSKANALSLDDFLMTDEEKFLACPFKARRFKGMININRKLPYNDIRLNATDVHDIFIKWEVKLRNTQKKYGRILKSGRAIVPASTGDEEFLQTNSTQCHNSLLLPSHLTNEKVFQNTSIRKESDTDADPRKIESRMMHKKSRLRPLREKYKEFISSKSNKSRRNHEQANNTILLENSDDETREEYTSSHQMESTKSVPYRTRRRRIASGSSDDTAATLDCKKDACPICGILVNIKSLQAHANNCLDRSEMTSSYQGIISEDEPLPDEVLQISPKRV